MSGFGIIDLEARRKQSAFLLELKALIREIPENELSCKTVLQDLNNGKPIDAPAVLWQTFNEDPFKLFHRLYSYFNSEHSLVKEIHVSQQVYIKDFMINGEEGKEIDTNFSAKIQTSFLFELK